MYYTYTVQIFKSNLVFVIDDFKAVVLYWTTLTGSGSYYQENIVHYLHVYQINILNLEWMGYWDSKTKKILSDLALG